MFRGFFFVPKKYNFNICCYMIPCKEAYFILQYANMLHLSKAILIKFSFFWEN